MLFADFMDYPQATICEPLKLNSLFQCTRNVEAPTTTRLSLLVAAGQDVFALAGIVRVALLTKFQKPSAKVSKSLSSDDDLRPLVRKFQNEFHEGQAQLRASVVLSTGQDHRRTSACTHKSSLVVSMGSPTRHCVRCDRRGEEMASARQ